MSGPKTSRYTLTLEQRRILAEQRKVEQRKAVASESIKRAQKRLLQIGGMFSAETQIASELAARTGNDNGISALIDELEVTIRQSDPLIAQTNYDNVTSIEGISTAVGNCLKKAEELALKIHAISSVNEANLRSTLQDAIDEGFAISFADIKEIKPNASTSFRDEANQELSQLRSIAFLPQTYQNEISDVASVLDGISDDVFVKNFIAVRVNPLIKKIKRFIAEYKECQAEFEQLYAEYKALCDLYYYVAQEFVCSRSSIQALQAEIERIKETAAADDEQAYISDCLDEVMEEMGYTVLGSRVVVKRSGKRFRNELYSYGDGTAVNITYSSDGKIAMELGGIDTSDRVPTPQEAEKLCGSMEQFCDDFKEIEGRLLAKGVVLADRVSLLPPDAEYAQIINTSDYSMEKEAEPLNVKKQRSSVSKQKALRRE